MILQGCSENLLSVHFLPKWWWLCFGKQVFIPWTQMPLTRHNCIQQIPLQPSTIIHSRNEHFRTKHFNTNIPSPRTCGSSPDSNLLLAAGFIPSHLHDILAVTNYVFTNKTSGHQSKCNNSRRRNKSSASWIESEGRRKLKKRSRCNKGRKRKQVWSLSQKSMPSARKRLSLEQLRLKWLWRRWWWGCHNYKTQ